MIGLYCVFLLLGKVLFLRSNIVLSFLTVIFLSPSLSCAQTSHGQSVECHDCPVLSYSGMPIHKDVERNILLKYNDFYVPKDIGNFFVDNNITKDGTGSLALVDSVEGKRYNFQALSGIKLKPGLYEARFLLRGDNISGSAIMGMDVYTHQHENGVVPFAGSEQLIVPAIGNFDWSWYSIQFPGYICNEEDFIKMIEFYIVTNSGGQSIWIDYMDISEIAFSKAMKENTVGVWCGE